MLQRVLSEDKDSLDLSRLLYQRALVAIEISSPLGNSRYAFNRYHRGRQEEQQGGDVRNGVFTLN